MPEGTIDGEPYPIALGDRGQTLWETTAARDLPDEVWDDWSLGLGETKRETGRGYLFAKGWDASTRGALRLSPFYHNLNNTALTTAYGYFMEAVETSGSTLAIDTTASSTTDANTGSSDITTFNHTVDSNSERLLVVGISANTAFLAPGVFDVDYNGEAMTLLGIKDGPGGTTDAAVGLWYLLSPATGTHAVSILNKSSAKNLVCGAHSWNGVNQDTPFGTVVSTTGTDGTPTVTVTTAATEEIIGVIGVEGLESFAVSDETEHWDAQLTDITGGGFVQDGATGGGDGIIAPTLDAKAGNEEWVAIAVSIKPSSATSRSVMMVADGDNIFKYTYDSDTGLTLDDTDNTASGGSAGRPEKTNGKWYVPFGSATNALKLDNASTPTWGDAGWKANHLRNRQKGVQPQLARVNSTTPNVVDFNDDESGDVGDTWSGGQAVGDSSTDVTDLVEAQGLLFPCKEDSVYEFGVEAESRNAIPFLGRGKADTDNGKGSFAFGDEIVYMSKGNLWRYRIGRGALPIGLNTIRSWRKIDDIIDTPKDARPAFGVYVEEYWYYLQNDGEVSHLIQARKRREGDPAGHELIQHSVLTIPISKGLGVDSKNRLWIKGASLDETKRDIRIIELAEDGSLDVQNRKGQASEVHRIFLDERNPGRPQEKVQIRHITVDLEGDWSSAASLQLELYLDDTIFTINHGAAITAAGVTSRSPTTFGTNDDAFRFRVVLKLTTNSSYTPKNSDPQVLRVVVGLRSAEILRIVIPTDEGMLPDGFTAIDVEQNLRRLQNQGTVTFRRPGDIATFTAEVFEVTDTMYATKDGFAHGIQVQARSFITP